MTGKILKKLSSKKNIPGTRGPLFLFRFRGVRDYKNSQICGKEAELLTTPWIIEKTRNLSAYEDRIYSETDRELSPVSDKISVGIRELENLSESVSINADNDESRDRRTAAAAATEAGNEERKKKILLELAQLRSELEVVDTTLKHHLERAEYETRKRISVYWSGVLKAAASEDMPVEPDIRITEPQGKEAYLTHYMRMMDRLKGVLGGEGNEAA